MELPLQNPGKGRRPTPHPLDSIIEFVPESTLPCVSEPPSEPMPRPRIHSQTSLETHPTQWVSLQPPPIGSKPTIASKQHDDGTRFKIEKVPTVTMSLFKEIAIAMADEMFRNNPTVNLESSASEAEFAMRRLCTVFSDSGAPGLPERRAARLPLGLTVDRFVILPNAVEMARLSPEVIELARKNLGWQKREQKTLLLDSIIEGLNAAIGKGKLSGVEDGTILVSLSEKLIVKIGLYDMLDDTSMLQYIRENAPQVPLPVTHGCLRAVDTQIEWGFMFMSNYYCNGFTLEELWGRLNHEEKWSISGQLNSIFGALRSVEPPHPFTGRREILGGGSPRRCKDSRGFTYLAITPLSNEVEFNSFLTRHPREISDWSLGIRSHLQDNHKMVMTYANLHPRNIIISPGWTEAIAWSRLHGSEYEIYDRVAAHRDWRVTCLVNWQRGGVYPEYWEYVKALNPADTAGCPPKWWYYLPRSIGVWPVEHVTDNLIVVP
ncbi:hypothetical protein AJ78_05570 [Emergomyces pasteurianus Ep9510]|uniref:Aminoglycoside phosphotransferase domain-containing protein n=1 Tax=Emergomyces pasteurianus Ep9510 TaxID=1447872 RepID=A0A1J9QDP1_9EURO|nr:hypothetical protein AJ78_05570 [Emergomyces pasteurianus Ep9510]